KVPTVVIVTILSNQFVRLVYPNRRVDAIPAGWHVPESSMGVVPRAEDTPIEDSGTCHPTSSSTVDRPPGDKIPRRDRRSTVEPRTRSRGPSRSAPEVT